MTINKKGVECSFCNKSKGSIIFGNFQEDAFICDSCIVESVKRMSDILHNNISDMGGLKALIYNMEIGE